MYEVNGWMKISEEDSFEEGCLPETEQTHWGDDRWSDEDVAKLIERLMDFAGVIDKDSVALDSCEDIGRIDIFKTENGNGNEPTSDEIERWKRGECKLWYCTYSFTVEYVKRSKVCLGKIRGLEEKYTGG